MQAISDLFTLILTSAGEFITALTGVVTGS